MNEILPTPPKRPKKYEFRGGTCPKHGNACAMRRCRLTLGPWECVECAHEAGTLQPVLAPVASPVPEQQTPPASTSRAVEASQPADTAERGAGVACPPIDNAPLFTAIDAIRKAVPPDVWPSTSLDHAALHDVGRAAREASLALDTLTQRIKHLLESAPPLVDAVAPLSTPQPTTQSVPESAAESQADGGGADADLPPGWSGPHCKNFLPDYRYGLDLRDAPMVWLSDLSDAWNWNTGGANERDGSAPTMLQAMCAALGIRLTPFIDWATKAPAAYLGNEQIACHPDIETCARRALERFHARQQPASNAIPECLCTWEDDEITAYHALCVVHASEHARQQPPERERRLRAAGFEPVDQRAYTVGDAIGLRRATHPDGSPRAGCDVCSAQGAPELGPRERGMRG